MSSQDSSAHNPFAPTPDNNALSSIAHFLQRQTSDGAAQGRVIPPLADWHPKHCGSMNLSIKANGEWWHEGQPIRRQALLDLFSKVLWKENGKFYLKTPVEQIEIEVEDEPLFISQVDQIERDGQLYLQLSTSHGDVILADTDHPIFMREFRQGQQVELRPYVHVRFGINALIQRASFYHLLQYGELLETSNGDTILQLHSGAAVFELGQFDAHPE